MGFDIKQETIERYPEYKPAPYRPLTRKQQIESIIQGIHNYLNSTELMPLLDNHKQKVWYQGGKAPWDALAKWESKLESL